jgi:F-type H+-transporting ATPase subunit gamma
MAGLKEIRTRISSIKTTRQVTSAMKMVSAAKLKKAQDDIIHFRPYAQKLHEILDHLAESLDCAVESPYCVARPHEKVLIVVITSNRGLCGGFNASITGQVVELIMNKYARQHAAGNVDILAIGKQGERQLASAGFRVAIAQHEFWSRFNYAAAEELAGDLMESFASGKYDIIELAYNEFVNAAFQLPVVTEFLPIQPHENSGTDNGSLTIYEPSKSEIALQLIPRMLKSEFYKAVLNSAAAEHGARMTAMHMATDNATELINDLTLVYNKARQASITKEILEISAGAEALLG